MLYFSIFFTVIIFTYRAPFKRSESQSTNSEDNSEPHASKGTQGYGPPLKNTSLAVKISQERLLTSRSASDVTEISLQFSPSKSQPPKIGVTSPSGNRDHISPANSFDHELGELERQLTNTRKSIDAKFYKSIANSPSPFFRPSKPPGLISPVENLSASDQDTIFKDGNSMDSGEDSGANNNIKSVRNSAAHFNRISSDSDKFSVKLSSNESVEKPVTTSKRTFEPVKRDQENDTAVLKPAATHKLTTSGNRSESLEISIESSKRSESTASTAYITPASPSKTPRQVLKNAEPITFEIDAKGGMVKKLEKSSSDEKIIELKQGKDNEIPGNLSDVAFDRLKSSSRETLLSDNEPSRKGSLVYTKVRDAAEIINERSKGKDSPVNLRRDLNSPVNSKRDNRSRRSMDHSTESLSEHSKLAQRYSHGSRLPPPSVQSLEEERSLKSPKLSARDNIIKALGNSPRNGRKPTKSSPQSASNSLKDSQRGGKQGVILDDSLTDTFARLDAAFAFKPSPSPDANQKEEKRKRRRNHKRRSRNFEPPASDSDDDDSSPDSRRRGGGIRIQLRKNDDPETASLNSKSEAEQSLEAAITDFHISLSSMPERKGLTHKRANSTPFYHQYSSDNNESSNPPKVVTRSSRSSGGRNGGREQRSKSQDYSTYSKRPLSDYSGSSSKSFDRAANNDSASSSSLKRRSEAKISVTTLRPWSPPLRRVEPSANILQHVKERSSSQKARDKPKVLTVNTKAATNPSECEVIEYETQITTETIAVEDQLSPLPDVPPRPPSRGTSRYTNSLPGRSNKRRRAAAHKCSQESALRSKSSEYFIIS